MCQYYVFHPSTFKLDGGAMFGIIPKPLWDTKITPDSLNRIPMSLRVLGFETKNKFILIDTGIGDYHGEKFDKNFAVVGAVNPLQSAIESASNGEAKKITDIILTHLHFDHVGGLGKIENNNFIPVFPNAKIHLHKKHYEYAINPSKRDGGSFQSEFFIPLIEHYKKCNQINWLDESEGEILNDEGHRINFTSSHGHTPHQIHPYDDKLIYMADILPTSHHLSIPWVMGYDISPAISTEDKERLYQFIMEKNLIIVFEHDIEYWGGIIHLDEKKRFAWKKLFKSDQKDFQKIALEN